MQIELHFATRFIVACGVFVDERKGLIGFDQTL